MRAALSRTIDMLYTLVLAMTATALFAKTAEAGLGWTIDECKERYGEPTEVETHALGLKAFTFSVKDFYIIAETDKTGKVGYISYTRPSIDEELAKQLMEQNAPGVVWKPYQMDQPDYKAWMGTEKASKTQYLTIFKKASGLSSDRASVAIGTLEFHHFKQASEKQEAKDQASGL
jgi:hypothetical protein